MTVIWFIVLTIVLDPSILLEICNFYCFHIHHGYHMVTLLLFVILL